MEKHIVITGSSRGIGFGLAKEFLRLGHRVTITGTREATVDAALQKLNSFVQQGQLQGFVCDVRQLNDVSVLLINAVSGLGNIDIWINNAGISQSRQMLWELEPEEYQKITEINQIGVMHGSHVAMKHFLENKNGALFNMNGFGSDGRMRPGMGLYGMSKRAVDYFTRSLMKEVARTPVHVGLISPGMVMTDLIYDSIEDGEHEAKKIFNILADHPETVCPWIVDKVLASKKNGSIISWLTGSKIMWRFLTAKFTKRDLWSETQNK